MADKNMKPAAYMHPDGRVVPAATMDAARADGGAMLSSLSGHTIELFTADQVRAAVIAERAACVAIAQSEYDRHSNDDCDTLYNEGASMVADLIIAYINERPLP